MPSPAKPLLAHLAHVGLRSPDPPKAARFYTTAVGLTPHESEADDVIRLGWGQGHHALELREGESGVDHIALEVPDRGSREELADLAEADGWIRDPDGNRIVLLADVDRAGEHHPGIGHRPIRVQHVTFASEDIESMVSFYVERLGFRVSDRMEDVFAWLRCDPAHHTIAVVAAERAGLDHYSYDVPGWADFKRWCDELAAKGVPITWGPGRHGPGNNLFVMFDDADGVRVELSAEMELYWDQLADYEPRRWKAEPHTTNLWGPNPTWRTVVA